MSLCVLMYIIVWDIMYIIVVRVNVAYICLYIHLCDITYTCTHACMGALQCTCNCSLYPSLHVCVCLCVPSLYFCCHLIQYLIESLNIKIMETFTT